MNCLFCFMTVRLIRPIFCLMLPTGYRRESHVAYGRAMLITAVALALAAGCSNGNTANAGRLEKPVLTVAVVPAVDSAGFFVALDRGLFKAQGLTVNFIPISSSATAIADQVSGAYDITGGNYVSYIQAQQKHEANLDIFAEGSVMEPGTQGIYTLPDSPV